MSERKSVVFDDFSGGQIQDLDNTVAPPGWYELFNLYIDHQGRLRTRPHLIESHPIDYPQGLALLPSNELLIIAGGIIYNGNLPIGSITGSGNVTYDIGRTGTVVTAGGNPVLVTATSTYTLNVTNVDAVALWRGFNKRRLAVVKSTNRREVLISASGVLEDFGTQIDDEWTEGFRIGGFPSDIIDIKEWGGKILIFTEHGIYSLSASVSDTGLIPQLDPVITMGIGWGRPIATNFGIIFVGRHGLYFVNDQVNAIPFGGMQRTILSVFDADNARLGFDAVRALLFLRPSNTYTGCFVYNFTNQTWTEWDISFSAMLSVSGVTYLIDNTVYRLTEIYQDMPIVARITSGILHMGAPFSRKRWLGMYVDGMCQDTVFYRFKIRGDEPFGSYRLADGSIFGDKLSISTPSIQFSAEFEVHGNLIIRAIILDYLEKMARFTP